MSSSPADTSNDSPNTLIITQVAQLNQVISDPGDSACPGDTISLYALNFANEYLWSTGDTTASIDVTTSGIYSVTTTDALGCESTAYDTIVFDPALCTGIAEDKMAMNFRIYPNPTNEFTTIQWGAALSNDAHYEILNLSGQIVHAGKIANPNASEQVIFLDGIADGMYFVVLHSDGVTAVEKLLVD